MKKIILALILFSAFCSCGQLKDRKVSYPLHVGNIDFDPEQDDPNFTVCDEARVLQYYNFGKGLQYQGEKAAINKHFSDLKKSNDQNGSGFLTIRFIVNCQGKTGRFRVLGMDNEYQEKTFSKVLVDEFLSRTKQMQGWTIGEYEGKAYDYYQYLTFKIESGKLTEIMP